MEIEATRANNKAEGEYDTNAEYPQIHDELSETHKIFVKYLYLPLAVQLCAVFIENYESD